MRQQLSSVSPKGQVTIPIEIRARLGLRPKDKVAFQIEGDAVKIVPAKSPLDASYQAVPALPRPVSLEDMERIIAEEAAHQAVKEDRA